MKKNIQTPSNKLDVLIVGCGNIAGKFDEEVQLLEFPLTHAGAYTRDGRFNLLACVEPNENRRKEFMSRWEIDNGYDNLKKVIEGGVSFDVVSICSPTSCHTQDIESILQLNPRAIFCEKPLTSSSADSSRLLEECKKRNILLVVNYSRRFDFDILNLKEQIKRGQWGKLHSIVGFYSKGLLNNGSHMVDLINLLAGPVRIKTVGKKVYDFSDTDPSIPVWLEGGDGEQIHILCNSSIDYSLFELQFVFQKGLISIEDGGLFWRIRTPGESGLFKGYRSLDRGMEKKGMYLSVMSKAVENLYEAIVFERPILSPGDNALEIQMICEAIMNKATSNESKKGNLND